MAEPSFHGRPRRSAGKELRRLDLQRDLEADWFLRETMVGYAFYIDRFAGTIPGVVDRLDYLDELGVTLTDTPEGPVWQLR